MASINRDSALPLYHQVKQALLHEIQSGTYSDGSALPSEKELQDQYGVSRITVRRALGDLAHAGYLIRQPGRGTFASSPKIRHRSGRIGGFPDDLSAQGFDVSSEVLEYRYEQVPEVVATKMHISSGQKVLYTKQLVRANGDPVAMGYVYHNYPPHVTLNRQELATDSAINLLRHKYELVVHHAERITELALATEEEARLLHIEANDPVFDVELIVFSDDGSGLLHVHSLYRGDRYIYHETIRI